MRYLPALFFLLFISCQSGVENQSTTDSTRNSTLYNHFHHFPEHPFRTFQFGLRATRLTQFIQNEPASLTAENESWYLNYATDSTEIIIPQHSHLNTFTVILNGKTFQTPEFLAFLKANATRYESNFHFCILIYELAAVNYKLTYFKFMDSVRLKFTVTEQH